MSFGFIGLGAMGAPMARQLLDAGHEVVVYDLRSDAADGLAGASCAKVESPRAVADRCEVVLASLPAPSASVEVIAGPDGVKGATKLETFVELSTVGQPVARQCAEILRESGVDYVDAPVSGGVIGARNGSLTVMVAGPDSAVDAAMPAFDAIGSSVILVGKEPGQAQVVKLANNLLSASAILLSAEAVLLAVKAGVDPNVAIEIISRSTGRNSAIAEKFPRSVVTRTFDSKFRLDLMLKDVHLCVEAATTLRSPMLVGHQVESLLSLADSKFRGGDSLDVVRMFEDWAGARIDDECWRQQTPRAVLS